MDFPDIYSDFHTTTTYTELKRQINETTLIVLHGKSGYGKSATAAKLVKDLSDSHQHTSAWLICSTKETLRNGLLDICKSLNMSPSKAFFKELFHHLNGSNFENQLKWFVFDDMDMASLFKDVLAPCLELMLGNADLKKKWRIIITTKQEVPADLNLHPPLAAMVPFEGFTLEDSVAFFPEAPEKVRMVHVKFLRSPHALRIVKKESSDLSCFDDDVMRELDRMAERSSVRGHDQKQTIALLEWIIKKNFGSGVLHELLGCIAFFDEQNISEELLHSCMEALRPDDGWKDITDWVKQFRAKMTDRCLTSLIPSKTAVTIHELTREALRVLFHDGSAEEKRRFCSCAMTALTRVLDTDGRFDGRLPSENMAHAAKLAKFLKEKPPIFMTWLPNFMLMHAEILYALAYADLKRRSSDEDASKNLKDARDLLCHWLSGVDYEKFKGKQESDPKRIGKRLYKATSMAHCENYTSHAKYIQQFRRLTDKDFDALKVHPADTRNKHLTVPLLEDLRKPENSGALSEEKFIRLFVAECVAQVFYLIARIPSFFGDDCPMELVKEAIHCAEVAKSIYEKIEAESEVKMLNKVLVMREELQNRLRLIGQEEHAPETGQAKANLILTGYEGMLNLKDNAYEYGIKRSKLDNDEYHKMLCRERMLLCHGWLVHFDKEDSRDEGRQLYKKCKSNAEKEKRKYTCLSNLEEFHAQFLFLCREPTETVCKALIDALRHLYAAVLDQNTRTEQKQSVVQQGRFSTLCKLLKKYILEAVDCDNHTRMFLGTLIMECEACGRDKEREILNSIVQKMRPIERGEEEQGEHYSEVVHPEQD